MIVNTEASTVVSTTTLVLSTHQEAGTSEIDLLVRNTTANGATLATTNPAGRATALAGNGFALVRLAFGETLTAVRSGASDTTLAVLRLS